MVSAPKRVPLNQGHSSAVEHSLGEGEAESSILSRSTSPPLKMFGLFDVIYDVQEQVPAVSVWGKSGDRRY